jgi:nucleoside-diphosphate-sugar epimerase
VSPRSDEVGTSKRSIDLADIELLPAAVRAAAPEAIIHLAAISGAAAELDPAAARRVNVEAVSALGQAADELGVRRFVFASSSAVYGDRHSSPISEDAPTAPGSSYAQSKLDAEAALAKIANASSHFRVFALRIFNVYGDRFPRSLVTRLLASQDDPPVDLRGGASFVRDYVQADDVADALLAALTAPADKAFTVLNIGSGIPVSNPDLVAVLGRSVELNYRETDGSPSYSCANIQRASVLLGWSPRPLGQRD